METNGFVMPHKYELGQVVIWRPYQVLDETITVAVVGRMIRENRRGHQSITYRCQQYQHGRIMREIVEIDEEDLQPIREVDHAAQ
jgi:hypothetical protein